MKKVHQLGIEVFGSEGEFNKWIQKPAYGLDFKIPKELMKTKIGVKLVEDELVRISYGELA